MIEKQCDLWEEPCDALCITTNGFVKKNGRAVMGRGCAKEAAIKYPQLPRELGDMITRFGNTCFWFFYGQDEKPLIITFPVKHNWWEKADLNLIEQSAKELVSKVNLVKDWKKILLPRPGCGNGQLDWETEVKPILDPILDDRFIIVYK